jgi:hypothetical protein
LRSVEYTVRRALSVAGNGRSVVTVDAPMATAPDDSRYTGFQMPALRSATKELPLAGFLPGP